MVTGFSVEKDSDDIGLSCVPYGALDCCMGNSLKNNNYIKCGKSKRLDYCVTYFGYIDLTLPLYQMGYFCQLLESYLIKIFLGCRRP